MKKLVLFGDGLLAQCTKDKVLFLEEKLNNEYDVYNCAVGGWNSEDLLKKSAYTSKLQPDVLIISIGTNDGSPWKQVPLEKFKANLKPIAEIFKGTRIIFFPPPPVTESRMQDNKKISNDEMRKYNEAVLNFCRDNGFEYWDSWTDLLPFIGTDKDPHIEDGVHFTESGYEFILSKMAKVIEA